MFQKSNKSSDGIGNSINLIGADTTIIGNINSQGDIRIDGTIKGDILTKGKLVVGPSGKIEGNVTCQNADVSGEIKGKISITDLIALKSTAKILGDMVVGKISIEPNALFTGTCNMGAVVKKLSNEFEEQSKSEKTA